MNLRYSSSLNFTETDWAGHRQLPFRRGNGEKSQRNIRCRKCLTKNDVIALVAFYSGSTGKKMLKNMPAMMGEAMQAMQPTILKRTESMK